MSSEVLLPGHAVQIITLVDNVPGHSESRRHLRLDRAVVNEICKKAKDHPIAVVAIAGPARRGKSLMLSYVVRYLTALEQNETPGDWMDQENPEVSLKGKGFKFQNGVETTTEGIWMWSRPFIISQGQGQSKLAVLLMDTAGCFDSSTSEAEESAIIGLSLLTSSCFIFNESLQINQNTLTTLAKFMQYGQLASKTFGTKSFQRIMFLVRDWNVPTKYEYGAAGGRAFITDYMTPTARMSKEAVHNRQSIQECFENFDCYLIPHPGAKVLKEKFTGSVAELTKEFREHIESFTMGLITEVAPKKHADSLVNGEGLFALFTEFVDAFNSQDMPSPVSILRANIKSTYESKLRQEVVRYEREVEKKICRQPFILLEKLTEIHHKNEKISLSNFDLAPTYPPYERDKKDFRLRLEDEIRRSYIKISQNLKTNREDKVSGAERVGQDHFENSIQNQMGVIFWSQKEFDEIAEKAKEIGLEEFLKACDNPPNFFCDIIIPPFLQKLNDLKENYWFELEGRRSVAEGQISQMTQTLKVIYLEDLTSNLDENYVNPKSLKLWHQRGLKKSITSFQKEVTQFNFLQPFVDTHQKIFEQQLHVEFTTIEKQNEQKLTNIQAQAQRDIDQALRTFDERANEEVFSHIETAGSDQLSQIHQEILDLALDCLNESDIADLPSLHRTYVRMLEDQLKAALKKSIDVIANSHQRKVSECQKTIDASFEYYCLELASKIGTNDDNEGNYLDPGQFDRILQTVVNTVRPQVENSLKKIDPQSGGGNFLIRFDELVTQENGRRVNQNGLKKREAESKVERAMRNAKQNYYSQLAQIQIQTSGDSTLLQEELEQAHAHLVEAAVQNVANCGVQSQQLLTSCQETLVSELELELANRKKVLEVKAGQLQQLVQETLDTCEGDYEMHLTQFLQENPFASNREFDTRQDRIFKDTLTQFEHQIQANSTQQQAQSPQQLKKLVEQLKNVLRLKKKSLKELSQKRKREASENVDKLLSQCLFSFIDALNGLSGSEGGGEQEDEFEKKSTKLLQETETFFETNWPFPPGPKKEEALLELRKQMHTEFKQVAKIQMTQRVYAGQALAGALASLCLEIDSHLRNGGFLDTKYLDNQLQKMTTETQQRLKNDLRDQKINSKDTLEKFQNFIQPKFEAIRLENSKNRKNVESQLTTNLVEFYSSKKTQIKTRSGMDELEQQLVEVAVNFFGQKFMGDDDNQDENEKVVTKFKNMAKDYYSKIVEQISQTSNEKTRQILEKAVETYSAEMTRHLNSMPPGPAHPDDLASCNKKSLEVCLQEAEAEVIILTDHQKSVIGRRIENTFRIFQEKNSLLGAQAGNLAIGIDLGTTTSCVAVYQNGKAVVIKDESNRNLTPSYVYFPEQGTPIVGQDAKKFAQVDPENTIFDAKRLIGRQFNDPHVQSDMKTWPFTVQKDKDGTDQTKIVVRDVLYSPHEISAQVLKHMKEIAQNYFGGKTVTNAVITVPANFTDHQRDATRQAAQVAGLNVLQIINEPTAAAIAHALSWKDEERLVLVFDFGGGTFDTSILKSGGMSTTASHGPLTNRAVIPQNKGQAQASSGGPLSTDEVAAKECEGGLQVLTTLGDTHLGGEDFDSRMVEFCVAEFEKIHPVRLLIPNPQTATGPNSVESVKRRLRRMRDECEEVKRNLTTAESAIANLDAIYGTLDLRVTITRAQFEAMNEDLFQKSMDIVRRALEDANVPAHELSDVIMVGGSSRIPRVRQLLQELLGSSSINIKQDIDIQEAVALGASVQACIWNGGTTTRALPRIKDVQPFSLGIRVLGGKMSPIIKRNSSIPCEAEEPYITTFDNQDEVEIVIYSGEERMAARNTKLGRFMLTGVPPGRAGSQQIRVHMKIDESGILNVTATCVGNGKKGNLVIQENRGRLTDLQVSEMRARAERGGGGGSSSSSKAKWT